MKCWKETNSSLENDLTEHSNPGTQVTPHWSFWLIGGVTLLWNAMGAINFIVQMMPGTTEAYRASEQAIITGRPVWATVGFFVAVVGGTAGSALLLLRNKLALPFFLVSFVGVLIATLHTLTQGIQFGMGEIIGIIAMPMLIAGLLVWYAKRAQVLGWIKS